MKYGIKSVGFALIARNDKSDSCLAIYNEGHVQEDVRSTRLLISQFLRSGCDVGIFSMPLHGESNNQDRKSVV